MKEGINGATPATEAILAILDDVAAHPNAKGFGDQLIGFTRTNVRNNPDEAARSMRDLVVVLLGALSASRSSSMLPAWRSPEVLESFSGERTDIDRFGILRSFPRRPGT